MKKLIKNYNHSNPLYKDFIEIDGNILPKIILHFFYATLREIFSRQLVDKFF